MSLRCVESKLSPFQDVERGLLSISAFCFRSKFRKLFVLFEVCHWFVQNSARRMLRSPLVLALLGILLCKHAEGFLASNLAGRSVRLGSRSGNDGPVFSSRRDRQRAAVGGGTSFRGSRQRPVWPVMAATKVYGHLLNESPSSPRCSRLPLAHSLPYAHALQGHLVQHSSSLFVLPLQQARQYSQAASEASWEEFDKEGECTIENVGRGFLARRPFAALFGRQHDQPRLVTAFPHALFPLTPLHLPLSLPGNVLQLDGCRRYSMHDFDLHGRMQQ